MRISEIKITFCIFASALLLSSCEKQEEPLNYTSISEFYGAWELSLEKSVNPTESTEGYTEYLKLDSDGTLYMLKIYNPEFYPDEMKDLNVFTWDLLGNLLTLYNMGYHLDYCSGNDIFISRGGLIFKMTKITETLWEYYINPEKFEDYQSVNKEGVVLNYKSIEDFYGEWKLGYADDSFGHHNNDEVNRYVTILSKGVLLSRTEDVPSGQIETQETEWRIKDNSFYWGILNYDVDYCKPDEVSLSRSATHLILTRIP